MATNWNYDPTGTSEEWDLHSVLEEAFPGATAPGGTAAYTESSTNSLYREDMVDDYLSWMQGEGAAEFEGWTDQQKSDWLYETALGNEEEAAASQWWTEYGLSVDEANARTEEDRNTMLTALADYKTAYGTSWVETLLAEERASLNAAMNASLQAVQQQFASMGRVADPFIMGQMQSQLEIAAEQQYATRQAELESQKVGYEQKYLDLLSSTMSETQYDVPSLTEALAVLEALGTSSAS